MSIDWDLKLYGNNLPGVSYYLADVSLLQVYNRRLRQRPQNSTLPAPALTGKYFPLGVQGGPAL